MLHFPEYNLLQHHQIHSTNCMNDLESWCKKNVENSGQDSEIEPNSALYTEIMYLLNHWEGLTSFLRIEGASLDNNIAERILRLQVINRKNSLFYKTEHGALVGDIICSIIKTSEETKINPFEYLVWVQENAAEVKLNPEKFMPWSFKQK
ncbi:MAG: transposase [Bacteriovorax sp.]|nr:transposase [Bacteriovorax sp.]